MTTHLERQLAASVNYFHEANLQRLRASFESGYVPEPNSGCWLWVRSLNNKGYGKLCGFGNERSVLAHRFSYELHKGSIPDGLVLDHKCRTPACVNPDHLEAVTQKENSRRGALAHIVRTGRCAHGHATEFRFGRNYCNACHRIWAAKYRSRKEWLTGRVLWTGTTCLRSTCRGRTAP